MKMAFHLVEYSPWPLISAGGGLFFLSGLGAWFHQCSPALSIMGLLVVSLASYNWWRDVCAESTFSGCHSTPVSAGLRLGMLLFILSEVCFFFAFFWAFFHSSLAPELWVGSCWPPTGITPLEASGVPLLNTVILLSSGATLTWSHHCFLCGARPLPALALTCLLGGYFTYLQAMEYMETSFSLGDGAFGSCFFVATGFHGLHVMIGTTALAVMLARGARSHFSTDHHVGLECSCWYWHFVDVVWLFLFVVIYWWGSYYSPLSD